MTSVVQTAENKFISSEPVIAAHIAAAVVGYVLSLLITHGVITSVQASAVDQQAISGATALALLLLGFVVRRFVSPAAKFAERVTTEVESRLKTAPTVRGPLAPVAVAPDVPVVPPTA